MSKITNSKSDELNTTQSFDGGFINIPGYTTAEIAAFAPVLGTFPLVFDTDLTVLKYWNGTIFETLAAV
jgi:hypothetical protein